MLDKASPSGNDESETSSRDDHQKQMNPWLRNKLDEAGVLNIIEPFWSSSYTQVSFNTTELNVV